VTTVLLCRGCCCGTEAKHPDVDHDAQRDALAAALGEDDRLHTVDCLGPCERSNVVVVRTGPTRTWFGEVLTPELTSDVVTVLGGGELPERLAERRFDPTEGSIELPPLGWSPVEIADVAHRALTEGQGTWTIGVHGGLAEFAVGDDRAAVERHDRRITARTGRGTLHLDLAEDVVAHAAVGVDGWMPIVVLATPTTTDEPVERVTFVDDDLVDLGLGARAARFCLRVEDDELRELLRAAEGRTWHELLDAAGAELRRISPTRIVSSAVGHIEVRTPIPPPTGVSPDGPHTHLLPGDLALDRELAVGLELPPGWTTGAVLHPPPGW
jgi:(2Fe-2S) ferredoxin